MKQNNQSSWAARLRKFSALCLMLVASANVWADDKVTAIVKPGETQQIAILLKNATDYTAFQMTIKLPDGLEFADASPVLTGRKDASHKLEFNKADASTIKLAAYSYDKDQNKGNEAISGNEGDLVLINVTANKDYVAKNIVLSDVVFVKKSTLEAASSEELSSIVGGLLGDVNGDNEITAQDAALIRQYAARKISGDAITVEVANTNGVDDVTAQDAALVQQFAAKKIKNFYR